MPKSDNDIVFIHIGQGGVQLGSAFWEMVGVENTVDADGNLASEDAQDFVSKYYDVGNKNTYVPRSIFIDSDPSTVDELRTGVYRNLFNAQQMISHTEDASNNYARGCFYIGKRIVVPIIKSIRKVIERCDNLDSFFITTCGGGGTGSGITPLVLLSIVKEYPKISRNSISLCPSTVYSTSVVEPYNMALKHFSSIETCDLDFLADNESLYDICSKNLLLNSPTYSDINRILSVMITGITSSLQGQLTNLIPYPRIHYPLLRYAPISHSSRNYYDNPTSYEITKQLFYQRVCQTLKIDTNRGLYMAVSFNYRGAVNSQAIYRCLREIKERNSHRFVDWSPSGFKVAITSKIPVYAPSLPIGYSDQSAVMMINTTAIVDYFRSLSRKFDLLFNKKSFVFWYLNEGMEDSEFLEARNELDMLVDDLEHIKMTDAEVMETMEEEDEDEDEEEDGNEEQTENKNTTETADGGVNEGGANDGTANEGVTNGYEYEEIEQEEYGEVY